MPGSAVEGAIRVHMRWGGAAAVAMEAVGGGAGLRGGFFGEEEDSIPVAW